MEIGKFLISTLVFVFAVFLMFPLEDSISAMTYTGPLKPLLEAFPLIFIVTCAIFPVFFLIKEDKD